MKVDREKALIEWSGKIETAWSPSQLAAFICDVLESQSHLWERGETKTPEQSAKNPDILVRKPSMMEEQMRFRAEKAEEEARELRCEMETWKEEAGKAEELADDVATLEANQLERMRLYSDLERENERLRAELSEANEACTAALARHTDTCDRELEPLRAALARERSDCAKLSDLNFGLKGKLSAERGYTENAEAEVAKLRAELERCSKACDEAKRKADDHRRQRDELERENERLRASLEKAEARIDKALEAFGFDREEGEPCLHEAIARQIEAKLANVERAEKAEAELARLRSEMGAWKHNARAQELERKAAEDAALVKSLQEQLAEAKAELAGAKEYAERTADSCRKFLAERDAALGKLEKLRALLVRRSEERLADYGVRVRDEAEEVMGGRHG